MAVSKLSFPEENIPELQKPIQLTSHQTLVYLLRLLNRTGYSVAIVYAVCMLVIKPLLELNYKRRCQFMEYTFSKVTTLYSRIAKRVKHLPTIEQVYNGRIYKDETSSTSDLPNESYSYLQGGWSMDGIKELEMSVNEKNSNDSIDMSVDRLSNSLDNMKRTLEGMKTSEYKKADGYLGGQGFRVKTNASEMQPLLFQIKQLKNYMEMVNADHPRDYFFKRSPLQNLYSNGTNEKERESNYLDSLHREVNECEDLIEQIRMVHIRK